MLRALAIVAGITAGCHADHAAAPDAASPDAFTPDPSCVYVEHFVGGYMSGVEFTDPSGMDVSPTPTCPVTNSGLDDGNYAAAMSEGGSVTISRTPQPGGSCTARYIAEVEGVQPGDRYDYTSPVALPADCVTRAITNFTVDPMTGQETWVDPDAASVDARIIDDAAALTLNSPCGVRHTIDGLTTTFVTSGPPSFLGVTVISCPHESYDDIRSAVVTSIGLP